MPRAATARAPVQRQAADKDGPEAAGTKQAVSGRISCPPTAPTALALPAMEGCAIFQPEALPARQVDLGWIALALRWIHNAAVVTEHLQAAQGTTALLTKSSNSDVPITRMCRDGHIQ